MAIAHISIKPTNKGRAIKSGGRSAKGHAKYICREGEYAKGHSAYIARDGAKWTERRNELVAVEHHNMPDWTEGRHLTFWDAADTFERANGRVYNEIEFSLPRELTPQQRLELAREFAAQELGDRYTYTIAVHNSKALDGKGNPHVHLMFSERSLDGIEREREQFFKRYNPREPELGGAKKTRLYSKPEELEAVRERFAKHTNLHLEKAGHDERIDHRSLKRQGIEREPEPKLGPAVTQRLKRGQETELGDQVMELREYRKLDAERARLDREIGAQEAKIYDLETERKKRVCTMTASPGETKEQQAERAKSYQEGEAEKRRASKSYRRTVDLVMDKKETGEGIEYRWKRSSRVAFIDRGERVDVYSQNEKAYLSAVQVAKEKGWSTIRVHGKEEFRRGIWLEGKLSGVEVNGYEATREDFNLLEKRKIQKEEKARQYRQVSIKEYPAERIEKREVDERGAFSERADALVKRVWSDIHPRLEMERTELFAERQRLGLEKDRTDVYGIRYVYKPTNDADVLKQREHIEKRFERVKAELDQSILFQRSIRELGDKQVEVEWTRGKRSLRLTNPGKVEEMVKKARALELEKRKLGRGRGR